MTKKSKYLPPPTWREAGMFLPLESAIADVRNDLARHNAEHAQMSDRLEAMHLLMAELRAILLPSVP